MENVYAAMLLHKAGKEINEENVTNVLTAAELHAFCQDNELLITVMGSKGDRSQKIRLGKALKNIENRVYCGLKIVQAGKNAHSKINQFCLQIADQKQPSTSSSQGDFLDEKLGTESSVSQTHLANGNCEKSVQKNEDLDLLNLDSLD